MFARVIKHVSGCQSGILSPLRHIMMMQNAEKSVKWLLIFLKLSQEYQKSNNLTFFKLLNIDLEKGLKSTFHLENLEFKL